MTKFYIYQVKPTAHNRNTYICMIKDLQEFSKIFQDLKNEAEIIFSGVMIEADTPEQAFDAYQAPHKSECQIYTCDEPSIMQQKRYEEEFTSFLEDSAEISYDLILLEEKIITLAKRLNRTNPEWPAEKYFEKLKNAYLADFKQFKFSV